MRRRLYAAITLVLSVLIVAGPSAAHDFTGSEEKKTKNGTVYTNNVRCRSGGTDVGGAKVYRTQSGTSGGVGVCNDGKGALGSRIVQGRAVATGDVTKGATVYADGDRDNSQNESAKGFLRVDASRSGVNVRCGDDNGRRDATHTTSKDGREDCG